MAEVWYAAVLGLVGGEVLKSIELGRDGEACGIISLGS
jgi:hypothetical protein